MKKPCELFEHMGGQPCGVTLRGEAIETPRDCDRPPVPRWGFELFVGASNC